MILEKLLEIESAQEFEDVNAIRRSRIHSFLDEWVVTDLLGRGSFGNVYKIVKPQPGIKNQECALKICQVNNPEDAELISQEIKMQMALSGHPNAVQIEDYALISREPPRVSYLLIRMELLSPLPAEGLSERETIQLGIDICSVLEKCASMEPKLVHCDIKPANILVSPDGRYKLGDFGTAKTLQATMTYTGNRGTPMYMAPEVASYTGYDSRCDIFSLGYTMLTMLNGGRHPYETAGDRSDVLRAMYETKKPPHIKGVSSGLLKIIRKMCEPNLHARYSRASEVRRDLEQFVRKKAEAERQARLEAERQAEIARKKAKAEREKSLRLAQNAVEKAEYELSQAQNSTKSEDTLTVKERIRKLDKALDHALIIRQQVIAGSTYEDALSAVSNGKNTHHRTYLRDWNEYSKRKHISTVVLVVLMVVIACVVIAVGGGIALNNGNSLDSTDSSPFFLEVDKTKNVVSVYAADKNGEYTILLHQMICSTEIEPGEFPDGMYYLSSKGTRQEWKEMPSDEGNQYVQFACEITDDFMFYSVPYASPDNNALIDKQYNALGTSCTDGGICMTVEGAKWIFDHCPSGTPVQIMRSDTYDAALIEKIRPSVPLYGWDPTDPDPDNPYYDSVLQKQAYVSAAGGFELELIYDPPGYKIVGCNNNSENIVIPSEHNGLPIAELGDNVFSDRERLAAITIPNSITSIGNNTFSKCIGLKEIDIPDSVTAIGYGAFNGCSGLQNIQLSEYITSIGKSAFQLCRQLSEITIPDSVTSIGEKSFLGCTALSEITIPNSITEIAVGTFQECTNLKTINIPDGLTTVGDSAFSGCSSLQTINLPDSVTFIGHSAFSGCTKLTEIKMPNKVAFIGNSTFSRCSSLAKINIPESANSIGTSAFSNCAELKEIVIPESVISIGNSAFYGCTNLTVYAPGSPDSYGTNLGDYKEWIIQ